MHMVLRDVRFPVREAAIGGYIQDPYGQNAFEGGHNEGLCWGIDVQMKEHPLGGVPVTPRIYADSLPFRSRHWSEIEGHTVHIADSSTDLGAQRAYSYFGSQELLPRAMLHIGQRTGRRFHIRWEGVCDPRLAAPFEAGVPFLIEAEATLHEISVLGSERDSDATMLGRLARYLDPADFIQYPMRHAGTYPNGVGMRRSLFRLREPRNTRRSSRQTRGGAGSE